MYAYELMEPGCYYLVQEQQDTPVTMIKILLESDHALYVASYGETESHNWKKKTDTVHEIIELLSDKTVKQWETLYNNNEDAFYEEDEE